MKRKYTRKSKSITSDTKQAVTETDCQHGIFLSHNKDKHTFISWHNFTKAMYNSNNNIFIPNKYKKDLNIPFNQNRDTKPTYEDNNLP